MNRLKQLISMSLAGVLLMGSSVSMADTAPALSLDEATALALKSSTDLSVLDKRIVNAQTDQRMAESNIKFYENKAWSSGAERQSNALYAYLVPVQKSNAVLALKREKVSKTSQVKIDVMNQYYDIVKVQNAIDNKKIDLAFYEKEYASKQKELSVGKITLNDLRRYEVKKKEAQQGLKKLQNDLTNAYMSLNTTVGKSVSERYTVKLAVPQAKAYTVADVAAFVKLNQEKSDSVLSQQESIAEKDLEIQTLKTYGLSDVYNDSTAQTDLKDKELALDKAKKQLVNHLNNVEYSIKSDLNKLQDAYTDIEIALVNVDIASEDFKVAEAKYKLGLLNSLDYATARDAKTKAESSLESVKMNYEIQVETFKKNYEINAVK